MWRKIRPSPEEDLYSHDRWCTIQREPEIRRCCRPDEAELLERTLNQPDVAQMPKTNSKHGNFSKIGVCEKLLTKSKIFEIRKVLSERVFMRKIFKMNFRSLHHFDIWRKCSVNSCQMTDLPFVNFWWRFGSDFSRPTVELFRSIVMFN